jgi:hypothetical protein
MPDEIDNLISEVIRDYRELAAELYSVSSSLKIWGGRRTSANRDNGAINATDFIT